MWNTQFKTDRRLWISSSLILFVIPWFAFGSQKMGPPIYWLLSLFTYPHHIPEALPVVLFYSVLFGIPALAIGWVIHACLVIMRDKVTQRPASSK